MNDLSWLLRRAAARWLFVERRMELVGEEIVIGTTYAPSVIAGRPLAVATRQVDALGLTRQHEGKRRELRAIEVKVSRGDLLAGIRKGQISNGPDGIGSAVDFAHLLVLKGVHVDFGELPERWGVLVAREFEYGTSGELPARKGIAIDVERPARRLTPTVAIDAEKLARQITQSALWKLYDHRTDLVIRREVADTERGWGYVPREIAL